MRGRGGAGRGAAGRGAAAVAPAPLISAEGLAEAFVLFEARRAAAETAAQATAAAAATAEQVRLDREVAEELAYTNVINTAGAMEALPDAEKAKMAVVGARVHAKSKVAREEFSRPRGHGPGIAAAATASQLQPVVTAATVAIQGRAGEGSGAVMQERIATQHIRERMQLHVLGPNLNDRTKITVAFRAFLAGIVNTERHTTPAAQLVRWTFDHLKAHDREDGLLLESLGSTDGAGALVPLEVSTVVRIRDPVWMALAALYLIHLETTIKMSEAAAMSLLFNLESYLEHANWMLNGVFQSSTPEGQITEILSRIKAQKLMVEKGIAPVSDQLHAALLARRDQIASPVLTKTATGRRERFDDPTPRAAAAAPVPRGPAPPARQTAAAPARQTTAQPATKNPAPGRNYNKAVHGDPVFGRHRASGCCWVCGSDKHTWDKCPDPRKDHIKGWDGTWPVY